MPTFDFQCKKCSHVFEYSRPFGSTTKPACTECKSKATEKLMALPAIQFKGEGFYKTDSGKVENGTVKVESKEYKESKGNKENKETKPKTAEN